MANVRGKIAYLGGPLTDRERQVSDLVHEGYSNVNIAAMLAITEDTVKRHLTHIFEKTGAGSRLELVTNRTCERHLESRKRDLKVRISQTKHRLSSLEDELKILEECP